MLSRRSVRVKVMQVLYALAMDTELSKEEAKDLYWTFVDNTYDLFLYNLYVISKITDVSSEDLARRRSKHLPSEEDKKFTDRLSQNPLVRSIGLNKAMIKQFETRKFSGTVDKDHLTKIYNDFAKVDMYKDYVTQDEVIDQDHIDIMLELYRACRRSELFKEMMTDRYTNWVDDKSMVIGSVKKVIKSLPIEELDDVKQHYPDDDTVKEFGLELLEDVMNGDEYLLGLINPLLKNWDSERVASIDMILLKMAAAELLNFDTIPPKVTLNEYLEVAKMYSTDKSNEFINGVLDKLMKNLEVEGKLNKKL